MHTTWSSNDDMHTLLKGLDVVTDNGTTNAGVALNVHEVTNGNNNLLNLLSQFTSRCENQSLALLEIQVNLLQDGDRESSSLSRSGLSLSNDILVLSICQNTDFERGRDFQCLLLMTGMIARA